MRLPDPHRYSYFPPAQIFGKKLVPVYYVDEEPAIPLPNIAEVIGITLEEALRLVEANREILMIVDCEKCVYVKGKGPLKDQVEKIGLEMNGVTILVFAVDLAQAKNKDARERLAAAKLWMTAQVSNRLKKPGRRNQPRWDAGLSKEQARQLKERFDRL